MFLEQVSDVSLLKIPLLFLFGDGGLFSQNPTDFRIMFACVLGSHVLLYVEGGGIHLTLPFAYRGPCSTWAQRSLHVAATWT